MKEKILNLLKANDKAYTISEIEEILNSKIKQKKQMEQYKKSVIYEYVTGKKRVEGAEKLYG